jgi:hypothetical protein
LTSPGTLRTATLETKPSEAELRDEKEQKLPDFLQSCLEIGQRWDDGVERTDIKYFAQFGKIDDNGKFTRARN